MQKRAPGVPLEALDHPLAILRGAVCDALARDPGPVPRGEEVQDVVGERRREEGPHLLGGRDGGVVVQEGVEVGEADEGLVESLLQKGLEVDERCLALVGVVRDERRERRHRRAVGGGGRRRGRREKRVLGSVQFQFEGRGVLRRERGEEEFHHPRGDGVDGEFGHLLLETLSSCYVLRRGARANYEYSFGEKKVIR